jgi:predicted esterase
MNANRRRRLWFPLLISLLLVGGIGRAGAQDAPAAGGKSLLANGSFEEGSGADPAGWQRGANVPGVEYRWDRAVGRDGKSSLCLKKTAQRYFPIAQWVHGVTGPVPDRVKVSTWIKAEQAFKAIVDVQWEADGKSGHEWVAYVGAKEGGDPPADHDWKRYEGVADPPEGATHLRIALQIYGPGTVWFDEVRAEATGEPARTAGLEAAAPAAVANDLRAGGDPDKRYFLLGSTEGAQPPADGYRLLLVLPGGDGGPGFLPFVHNIRTNALSEQYLVAQLVAPVWRQDEGRVVWPTEGLPEPGMKFTTEAFIRAVVQDVGKRHKIDSRCVFLLGWSAGGRACYAASLEKDRVATGSFIAMSVFKPQQLPDLGRAKGHAYYLLHSPQDFIPIRMAEQARESLGGAGATVELATYEGGHGWRGDMFGQIRQGVAWLEKSRGVTPMPVRAVEAAGAAPNRLAALHGQITSPLLEQQNAGFRALIPIAFRDFAEDYPAYMEWHRRYADMPLDEVVRENCAAFLHRLAAAEGKERDRLARFLGRPGRELLRNPTALETARLAGLLEIAGR